MFSFIFLSVHFSSLCPPQMCVLGRVGFCEPIKCSWQRVKSPTCPPAAEWGGHVCVASLKEPPESFAVVDRRPLRETKCEGHVLICRF